MRQFILRAAVLYALTCALAPCALAQVAADANASAPRQPEASAPSEPKLSGSIYWLEEVRRQLREQREEIGELRARVEHTEQLATRTPDAGAAVRDAAYDANAPGATPPGDAAAQDSKLE